MRVQPDHLVKPGEAILLTPRVYQRNKRKEVKE
jgi:hypothetical protein